MAYSVRAVWNENGFIFDFLNTYSVYAVSGMGSDEMTTKQGFCLKCSYCDRPALSFKPGTAPRFEFGIMINRGEPGERRCDNLFLLKNCAGQRDLFSEVAA